MGRLSPRITKYREKLFMIVKRVGGGQAKAIKAFRKHFRFRNIGATGSQWAGWPAAAAPPPSARINPWGSWPGRAAGQSSGPRPRGRFRSGVPATRADLIFDQRVCTLLHDFINIFLLYFKYLGPNCDRVQSIRMCLICITNKMFELEFSNI